MALVHSYSRHIEDLTGGGTIAPGEEKAIDVTGDREQQLLNEGKLVIVNSSTPPAYVAPPAKGAHRAAWQAGVAYQANDLVEQGGALLSRIAAGTSRSSFDSTEAALWQSVSAGGSGAVLPWVTGTAYKTGQPVTNGGNTYIATNDHTAGATFASDVATHWTLLPPGGGSVAPWAVSTSYTAGASLVYVGSAIYVATVTHTSGGSFDASKWLQLSGGGSGSGSSRYIKGQMAVVLNASPGGTNGVINSGSPSSGHTQRKHYKIGPAGAADLRFYFANWDALASGGGEGTPNNAITIKASLEYAGVSYPIWFPNGVRQVTLDNGGEIESRPLGIELPANADVYVRVLSIYTTAYPQSNLVFVDSEGDGYSLGDAVDSTGAMTTQAGDGKLFLPVAITGRTMTGTVRQIGIIGDSIAAGSSGDTVANRGYIRAALGSAFPNINLAQGGEKAQNFAPLAGHANRARYIDGCDYLIEQFGINDRIGNRTSAQSQADRLAIWFAAARRGVRVYAATITPDTTGTFTTTAGQTKALSGTQEGYRTGDNDWIRDGAPIDATTLAPVAVGTSSNVLRAGGAGHPLAGYFDVADAAESARNSGIWKANYTSDGLHPNATGVAALAAAINTALFV